MIMEVGLKVDLSNCETEEDKLNKQLEFLKKRLEVK